MKRILTALWLASCCAAFHTGAAAQAAPTDDSLYKAFGEKAGLDTLMADFVGRLRADRRIGHMFKDTNQAHLAAQLADQLCMVSGGPCTYRGVPMKTAHADLDIGKGDFNALVEVLQESMDAHRIPFSAQNRMLARLAPMHRDIVTLP